MRKLKTCGTNTTGEKFKLRENNEYSQKVCMLKQVLHLHHRWLYPLPYLCLPTVPSNLRYLKCHPIILSSRMLELSTIWNHSNHFISHFLWTLNFKSFHVSLYKKLLLIFWISNYYFSILTNHSFKFSILYSISFKYQNFKYFLIFFLSSHTKIII